MATVITNYNIKQVTNYDIAGISPVYYDIVVPHRKPDGEIEFIVEENVKYITALSNVQILKLGYCCEPKGIIYPIFLQMNGEYTQIQIGKDGMYEMQPEDWKNVNDEDAEAKVTDVIVTGVRVPADVNFTLDYVMSIN